MYYQLKNWRIEQFFTLFYLKKFLKNNNNNYSLNQIWRFGDGRELSFGERLQKMRDVLVPAKMQILRDARRKRERERRSKFFAASKIAESGVCAWILDAVLPRQRHALCERFLPLSSSISFSVSVMRVCVCVWVRARVIRTG